MNHRIVLRTGFASTLLALAGCAARSEPRPAFDLPAHYQESLAPAAADRAAAADITFGSAGLAQLLLAGERANADVAMAVARVKQSDARARQAGAALLPSLDANGDAAHYRGSSHGNSAHETDWSALLSASYEFDFWGKVRASRDATLSVASATRCDLDAARMTVRAGIAALYLTVQSLRERLELARADLSATEDVLHAVQARFDAGFVAPAELATQRASVAEARLRIPDLEQELAAGLAAFAILLGTEPERFTLAEEKLESLRAPAVDPGLPAALLLQRPDIVAAEYNLHAAHADLRAARAAFLPDLSLSSGIGVANPAVNAAVIALQGSGFSLTLGASVVQSIFDGGRRRAVAREAAAREEELLVAYQAAIRAALADVETALARMRHLDEQRDAQSEALRQSSQAFAGLERRFAAGTSRYLPVLEAQRALLAARDRYGQYRLARLEAVIDLHKALGGDAGRRTP